MSTYETKQIRQRRNSNLDINCIYLCDIWGINHNSPRLVIRDWSNVNMFCLVSMLSCEITYGPATGEEIKKYLDGDNPHKHKFIYIGSLKELLYEKYKDKGVNNYMANIIVFKEKDIR